MIVSKSLFMLKYILTKELFNVYLKQIASNLGWDVICSCLSVYYFFHETLHGAFRVQLQNAYNTILQVFHVLTQIWDCIGLQCLTADDPNYKLADFVILKKQLLAR